MLNRRVLYFSSLIVMASSLYNYNFGGGFEGDGYLVFSSNATTIVQHNLFVNSNLRADHIVADTIENVELNTNTENIQIIGGNVAALSNYVYNLSITENNTFVSQVNFTDSIVLKSSTNSNTATIRTTSNDTFCPVSIECSNNVPTIAASSNGWEFYRDTHKIRLKNDIWMAESNQSVITGRVVCGSLWYDSWVADGTADRIANSTSTVNVGDGATGTVAPSYIGSRRIIIDSDGFIPFSSIKDAPNYKKMYDSVENAAIGGIVGTGILGFLGGGAAGFLFRSALQPRVPPLPRPPPVPSLQDPSGLNGGQPGQNPSQNEIQPADGNDPNNPANSGGQRDTNIETEHTEERDRRTGWWRRGIGSHARRIEEQTSRCCGCFKSTKYAFEPIRMTNDYVEPPFRGVPGRPGVLNRETNYANPLFHLGPEI